MKYLVLLIIGFIGISSAQAQVNLELKAQVTYAERLSDIWGYTDSLGREYALVCLNAGVAIEDISDPANPQRVARIDSPQSTWRDAKTYGKFAYFINESFGGVQIINLENLPAAPDSTHSYFWTPNIPSLGALSTCHNLYIDTETGYGFLAGCNINNGGIVIIDLFTNPGNPIFVAAAAPIYAHDVYTRGNFIYGSDINNGSFSIQNMENKDSIYTIARQNTPFNFTHNAWLSDDSSILFTTDERRDAPVGVYDISDIEEIKLLDEFRPAASLNEGLIPHNVHVKNDYVVTSFYTEGLIIMDAHRPQNLIEIANFDTFEGANGSFNGVWGAYPFFDSDIIIASDIGAGLYIFQPTYTRACYLEGIIADSLTGSPLEGVAVQILSNDPNSEQSNIAGIYKTGQVSAGDFQVTFTKFGYFPKTIDVSLENGVVTEANVVLVKDDSVVVPPAVSIIANTTEGCSPLTLNLSPSAVVAGTAYRWLVDGPVKLGSSRTNADFELTEPGNYIVTLGQLMPDGSLQVIDEETLNVSGPPEVAFEIALEGKSLITNNLTQNGTSYIWKFGDGGRSEATAPTYTYVEDGEYVVELTAFNECSGATTAQSIIIQSTSLQAIAGIEAFAAYPNPFTNTTSIEYRFSQLEKNTQLVISDLLGRNIQNIPLSQKEGIFVIGGNFQNGIYIVQLMQETAIGPALKVLKTGQ